MAAPVDERTQFQVDRLAYFSDAVFAIAITLLALNIHAPAMPQADERQLLQAVGHMVPSIIGFGLSFFVISNYWRAHHRLFRWVMNYDDTFVTLNLLLLLTVSFVPCPTAFYSDHPNFRTPLVFYTLSLTVVGLLQYVLWRYVTRRPELLRVYPLPHDVLVMGRRTLVVPVVSVLAVAGSFVALWLSGVLLMLIPVFLRIVTRLARPSVR